MSLLILGSASPRRRELLAGLGIQFEVLASQAEESIPDIRPVETAIEEVALRKARDVLDRVERPRWVLAADTVVAFDGRILGKPAHRAEARVMLAALSGRTHRVVTGAALVGPGVERSVSAVTDVTFRRLSPAQIEWYTALAEPYDKAGSYAIQGSGAFLVERIQGSYTNVVGLPMSETVRLLEEFDLAPWRHAEQAHDVR